jgi:hypothetical protein
MITNMTRRVWPALVALGLGAVVAACGRNTNQGGNATGQGAAQPGAVGQQGAAPGQTGAAPGAGAQGRGGAQIGGGPAGAQGGRASLAEAQRIIAAARCAQMERCGNVGPNQNYANPQVCIAQNEQNVRGNLNDNACAPGVLVQSLRQCEQELRASQCGTNIGSLQACQTQALCGSQ